ncbi:MAG: nitroreductase family protein [Porphyromonas sp.]|nr:nitroreductase family protein [Porphyromonas sp.]
MSKDIYTLIKDRKSHRKYDPDFEIPDDVIARIVEAGRLSPSACNGQPWHFIVVKDRELRRGVSGALRSSLAPGMNKFAENCSAFIVVVRERTNVASGIGAVIKNTDYSSFDIGIAVGFLTLAAEHEGLGSCIIGWLDKNKIRTLLNIPKGKDVPLVVALGKSNDKISQRRRKPEQEVISWDMYKKK